jgi:hypothetical protein
MQVMRFLRRAALPLVALTMFAYLSLSASGGDAGPQHPGPPLSSIALLSRFAREQGIAQSFQESGMGLPHLLATPHSVNPVSTLPLASLDTQVNQDFSLRPQNETTIAVNPSAPNMLVAGANDYRLGIPIGAAFYTSFDNGSTWNDGIPPYPLFVVTTGNNVRLTEPPSGTGDPVVAFGHARPGTGLSPGTPTAYYAYLAVSSSHCEHGIFVSRSTNGLTWAQPAVPALAPPKGLFTPIFWDRSENCSVFHDKPWLAVDNSGGPYDGRLYVTWSRFTFSNQKYHESKILMAYSDDNAQTWSEPREINGYSVPLCRHQISGVRGRCDESQFSSAVVGPDGTLHVAFINQQFQGALDGFRNQYLVVSIDPATAVLKGPYRAAGMIDGNFDFPVNSQGRTTLCNSNFRLATAGNLAVDPSDPSGQRLYIVFMDNRNGSSFPTTTQVTQEPPDSFACPQGATTDADIFIVKSTDGGAAWTAPKRVNQDGLGNGRDQWFPFAAVAGDGRVDVVFHDRRDDPFNRFAHVYLARSRDGGQTWVDTRVSSVPSNMNWAFGQGLFIGDYNGLAIAPDGTSYPFWTDARNGTSRVRQSDVFLDVVPP